MFGMSNDQITGQLRQLLPILGTLAAALGWISPEKANVIVTNILAIIGPIAVIVGIVWTGFANTQKALLQSASATPGTTIITTPELAQATPDEKNIISNALPKDKIASVIATSKEPTQ